MSVPIVIGTVAQALKKPLPVPRQEWWLSHKWCCYVRGLRDTSLPSDPMEEQDLSFLIKKVEFSIHDSFPESFITIDQAPFEIHNAGYGEFPITIMIYFNDPYERPLEYTHQLKIEADPSSLNDNNKTQKKMMAPVVFEEYNEITFFEPTEHFYKILMQNQYQQYSDICRKNFSQMSPEQLTQYQAHCSERNQEALQANIEKYQNYLQINSHKPLQRYQFKEKFL